MADAKKKNNNTRILVILALLVLAVAFFTWPFDGRTGYQRLLTAVGSSPTSTPARNTMIPRAAPQSQSQEIIREGRPRVDDGAHQAEPLDELSAKDKEALERLIRDVKK